ncbi:Rab guanyl-nucleotide exchange factor [Mycena chlorophos]|uniref:Rab guanyl-nucleotide exchange factor n=1 Tax=Mycena chlorophos TaxID=658473 RepID=A0A8H6TJK5_MYCCL|nr:Rab guanyl-nucleotide exchange factor [Mycena chlorophos]
MASDHDLPFLVLQSKNALHTGKELCTKAHELSHASSESVLDVLTLDARVRWISDGVLEQLRLAVSIAKTIEEKRASLNLHNTQEWDNVRKKHSDALDTILDALGSQVVPPDFHEHSSASSLFGSQHSDAEDGGQQLHNVLESPRQSLSTVRKVKPRPQRQTWKTLRDFVDDQAIEEVLERIENGRNHVEARPVFSDKTDDYPETLKNTTNSIRETLPHIPSLPSIDTLLLAQDDTITMMARHLESLAAHYEQMADALHETEAGEAFGEEDLQAMNRDTAELPAIIGELEEGLASIAATHGALTGSRDTSKKSLAHLQTVLDDLDELGEIMGEMLQTQDVVQNDCEDQLGQLQQHVDTLEHLHAHYVQYQTAFNKLLLEIARRRQYREAAENIVRGMMSQLAAMTEEESRVRDRFNAEHGTHLPEDLCLCIGNAPTKWEVLPWNGEEPEALPEIEPDLISQARERLTVDVMVNGMTLMHILATGATGYIGGTVLARLLAHPLRKTFSLTILVRSPEKAEKFTRVFGLNAVVGSNEDLGLLSKLSSQADVVIACTDADDLPATQAILDGLRVKHSRTGVASTLIHTSGTGVLSDDADGMFASETIYSDLDIELLESLPPTQPHRDVDLAIVAADSEGYLKSYIILPSTIYGLATGIVAEQGLQNTRSQQIPRLARVSVQRGQGAMIGEGRNYWNNVHIDDVADLFMRIFDLSTSPCPPQQFLHGRAGFYFAENGEHTLYDVGKEISRVLSGLGKGTSTPTTVTPAEMGVFFPNGTSLGSNSRCKAERGRKIGWRPVKITWSRDCFGLTTMGPFEHPSAVVTGVKDRIESIAVHGDRLYLGTATGVLHIYAIDDDDAFTLVESRKGLARKAIDQIGFIKDINSLVLLSEAAVSLLPLPSFTPATPLLKAKAAFSFAIHTSVQHIAPDVPPGATATTIPTLITQLVVGCRRKVVVYSWKDGEAQESKEAPLPHSARVISFLDQDTTCFGYAPTEYAMFSIPKMTATDISIPLPVTAAATGMSAFTNLGGLGGYMTLGLGAKPKPAALQIGPSEALILKDNEGIFVGPDGSPARPASIEWPAPPEEIAYVKPYVFSVLPPGSIPSQAPAEPAAAAPVSQPTTVVQIRSSISLQPTQTLSFPFRHPTSAPTAPPAANANINASVRILTPSPSSKSPLFMVTTPLDKTAATAEGSTIWQFTMKPWGTQIDDLVAAGQYSDALALLDTIDATALPDKDQRIKLVRGLNAVAQFRAAQFDTAIDTFIALDINPAKVVALYPESVAGRLSVAQDQWITLFGGPEPPVVEEPSNASTPSIGSESPTKEAAGAEHHQDHLIPEALEGLAGLTASTSGTIRGRLRGLGAFLPSLKDGSVPNAPKPKPKQAVHDDVPKSVETLLRYLSDRRPLVKQALAAVGITPENQSHEIAFLSETSVEDLFALPNAPFSALTPEQLLRFAQIVDTALFKSYLVIRPTLLGSLCRLPNWCEVSEVEEELLARKKFAELRDLYNGKKMHRKALDLLKNLSTQETDPEDQLMPSIYYLQKLGPEHMDEIFQSARWMFEKDSSMAFQIFTSEDVELPRQAVANYLESIDPALCIRYIEFLIEERREESPAYHDRLAELYLKATLAGKKRNDKDWTQPYSKLLKFIDTTNHYRIDRLYNLISSEDLFEARAILLGRFGRHDQALELYVYRLQDYLKAEQHCSRVYVASGPTSSVYLTLLRIYLQPNPSTKLTASDLLEPALGLIARHSSKIDSVATLELLPPLVPAQDLRKFLVNALHAPVFDARVVRHLSKARGDQVDRLLMSLQTRRVKVTDSRICPQCHKRIGNSFIAVHSPRGEVTHYQCREAFSKRLNETRH